jgi:hypothetical protein
MLVKPNTAFTGVPSGRVIGGRAWKARKMKPDPSIRTKWSGLVSDWVSMSAGVAGSRVQDIKARAVRANDILAGDPQENAGMAERTIATVACDRAVVYMDDLGRGHLYGARWGGAVRHRDPRSVRESGGMIAMRRMLSTMNP